MRASGVAFRPFQVTAPPPRRGRASTGRSSEGMRDTAPGVEGPAARARSTTSRVPSTWWNPSGAPPDPRARTRRALRSTLRARGSTPHAGGRGCGSGRAPGGYPPPGAPRIGAPRGYGPPGDTPPGRGIPRRAGLAERHICHPAPEFVELSLHVCGWRRWWRRRRGGGDARSCRSRSGRGARSSVQERPRRLVG
jgi:hypothetical protein